MLQSHRPGRNSQCNTGVPAQRPSSLAQIELLCLSLTRSRMRATALCLSELPPRREGLARSSPDDTVTMFVCVYSYCWYCCKYTYSVCCYRQSKVVLAPADVCDEKLRCVGCHVCQHSSSPPSNINRGLPIKLGKRSYLF